MRESDQRHSGPQDEGARCLFITWWICNWHTVSAACLKCTPGYLYMPTSQPQSWEWMHPWCPKVVPWLQGQVRIIPDKNLHRDAGRGCCGTGKHLLILWGGGGPLGSWGRCLTRQHDKSYVGPETLGHKHLGQRRTMEVFKFVVGHGQNRVYLLQFHLLKNDSNTTKF